MLLIETKENVFIDVQISTHRQTAIFASYFHGFFLNKIIERIVFNERKTNHVGLERQILRVLFRFYWDIFVTSSWLDF